MATQVQLRRGTTAQHSTFTGALGELTIDTDKDVPVVHDASTAGGFPLAKETHTHTLVSLGAENTDITIASGTTPAIGAAAGQNIIISGSTQINGFDTVANGIVRRVKFTGALQLTYNATSLILPGSVNITTAAGDCAEFESLGAGNWLCKSYAKRDGTPLVASASNPFSDATAIIKGSADATKLVRIEADGITTGTTRVWTAPDADITVAGKEITQTWAKPQIPTITNLTSSAASIAVNLALSNDFKHTATENTTLAAPSGAVEGQSGVITFTQHASSPKTLAFNTFWKFASGTVPTFTATNSAVDVLAYSVDPGAASATCVMIQNRS